jgi:hypothetical protein
MDLVQMYVAGVCPINYVISMPITTGASTWRRRDDRGASNVLSHLRPGMRIRDHKIRRPRNFGKDDEREMGKA